MSTPLIINSIFLECQSFTLDPFWKELFSRCAYNKFPKGLSYDRGTGTIYVKYRGNKKDCFSLSAKPEETFETMMAIFRNLGLKSPRDLQIQKKEMNLIRKELCVDLDCTWKELKPKYLKDRMITRYVLGIKESCGLTPKETRKLLTTIQLGFQLQQLKANDVKYEKGEILEIAGLKIDEKDHTFTLTRKIKRKTKKSGKAAHVDPFLQIFETYLKETKKSRIRL